MEKSKDNTIVKLLIPSDAKRSSATSRMCRCDKAIVLEIYDISMNGYEIGETFSKHQTYIHRVGSEISVDNFDENRWNEYSPGIYFFLTREEAELHGCI